VKSFQPQTTRLLLIFLMVSLAAWACESGTYSEYTFDIDAVVLQTLSPSAPGLLVLDGELPTPVAPLCSAESVQLNFELDDGFGCLPDSAQEMKRTAMIIPIPATWDTAAFCALAYEREQFMMLPAEMVLPADLEALAIARAESVPKLEDDMSPCGGRLKYTFTFAAP